MWKVSQKIFNKLYKKTIRTSKHVVYYFLNLSILFLVLKFYFESLKMRKPNTLQYIIIFTSCFLISDWFLPTIQVKNRKESSRNSSFITGRTRLA